MREDITFASSSACSERVAGAYRTHFCGKLASSRLHSPRAYPVPVRQGKANFPYFGIRSPE